MKIFDFIVGYLTILVATAMILMLMYTLNP